jgi:hypothetical protein
MHILSYIEPGTGALIWQSIVGIFVGLVFYLRQTRRWLGRLVGRMMKGSAKPEERSATIPINKEKVEADHP